MSRLAVRISVIAAAAITAPTILTITALAAKLAPVATALAWAAG